MYREGSSITLTIGALIVPSERGLQPWGAPAACGRLAPYYIRERAKVSALEHATVQREKFDAICSSNQVIFKNDVETNFLEIETWARQAKQTVSFG